MDRRILCSTGELRGRFKRSKIGKGLVGWILASDLAHHKYITDQRISGINKISKHSVGHLGFLFFEGVRSPNYQLQSWSLPDPYSTYPTDPFTILDPQNQEINEFYIVQERRTTDFKALKCERIGRARRLFARLGEVRWVGEVGEILDAIPISKTEGTKGKKKTIDGNWKVRFRFNVFFAV